MTLPTMVFLVAMFTKALSATCFANITIINLAVLASFLHPFLSAAGYTHLATPVMLTDTSPFTPLTIVTTFSPAMGTLLL
jgi:hypothetical protein